MIARHDEFSEVLGAYALDAVEPDEAAAIEGDIEGAIQTDAVGHDVGLPTQPSQQYRPWGDFPTQGVHRECTELQPLQLSVPDSAGCDQARRLHGPRRRKGGR